MGVVPVALGHGVGLPLVEGLLGEAEHPAGHRDGDVLGGELLDQRVDHFGRTSRAKYAVARRRISFSCSSSLFRRRSSRSSADSSFAPPPPRSPLAGRVRPSSRSAIFSQRCRQDSEIPKSRATWETEASPLRATAMTSRRNSAGNGLGTMPILPARPKPHRQGVNRTRGSPTVLYRDLSAGVTGRYGVEPQ